MKRHILLGAALLLAPVALAGQLKIGVPRISGDQVTIPVLLNGDVGKGVSTLDFDLKYDPSVFQPVGASAGPAATSANKSVSSNTPSQGQYRVIVMGMNQNTVTGGEVADIVLRKVGTPTNDQANLQITNTTFASPEAVEIPSQGDQSVIQLGSQNDTGSNANSDTSSNQTNTSNTTATTSNLSNQSATSTSTTTTTSSANQSTEATRASQSTPASATTAPQAATTATTKPAGTTIAAGVLPSQNPAVSGTSAPKGPNAPAATPMTRSISAPNTSAAAASNSSGNLAAAVQRVAAAHSAVEAQTAGEATPNSQQMPNSAPSSATVTKPSETGKTQVLAKLAGGLDKQGARSDRISSPNVVAPKSAAGQKKVLAINAVNGVHSNSASKAGTSLVPKIAFVGGAALVIVLIVVVRRKLFT